MSFQKNGMAWILLLKATHHQVITDRMRGEVTATMRTLHSLIKYATPHRIMLPIVQSMLPITPANVLFSTPHHSTSAEGEETQQPGQQNHALEKPCIKYGYPCFIPCRNEKRGTQLHTVILTNESLITEEFLWRSESNTHSEQQIWCWSRLWPLLWGISWWRTSSKSWRTSLPSQKTWCIYFPHLWFPPLGGYVSHVTGFLKDVLINSDIWCKHKA